MRRLLSDFDFELPFEQIAQHPLQSRSQSRLMVLQKSGHHISHHTFLDLPRFLNSNDLLVFNQSKVIPARIFGKKITGGKMSCLIERILSDQLALAHIKSNHSLKIGGELILENGSQVTIMGRDEGLFQLQLHQGHWRDLLDEIGHIPLPPYITREESCEDLSRYQTIYATSEGSVAAPTAGLHFDDLLLKKIKECGVEVAFITLHVGAGTFQPVRTEYIEDHQIHQEWVEVTEEVAKKVKVAKEQGGRVIAVGTTSMRALETASSKTGEVEPFFGATRLFIYPGYQFRSVNGLITNFHVPKSSLLMLVAAFAGYEFMRDAYQIAIKEKYRFLSYGDGMFILETIAVSNNG